MRVSNARVASLALALASLHAQAASAATTTCKRLTDADSTFVASATLAANLTKSDVDALPLDDIFGPINTMFPWLSTCVAAIDPAKVASTVMLSDNYKKCEKELAAYAMPDALDDASIRDSLCPFYKATIVPCVSNVVVATLTDAMAGSGGCCDAMTATIEDAVGSDLAAMVTEVLQRVGNVACTVKTYTNTKGAKATQSCGASLASTMLSSDDLMTTLQVVQMPTEQVCKAMAGQSFTTTMGATAQFPWLASAIDSVGICYEPVGAFIKMLADYPMMDTMSTTVDGVKVDVANLFAPGKCLNGDAFLQWLLGSDSMFMKVLALVDTSMTAVSDVTGGGGSNGGASSTSGMGASASMNVTSVIAETMTLLKPMFEGMCFHIANGQSCDYGTATVATAFSVTSPTPSPTSGAAASSPSTSGYVQQVAVAITTMLLAMSSASAINA